MRGHAFIYSFIHSVVCRSFHKIDCLFVFSSTSHTRFALEKYVLFGSLFFHVDSIPCILCVLCCVVSFVKITKFSQLTRCCFLPLDKGTFEYCSLVLSCIFSMVFFAFTCYTRTTSMSGITSEICFYDDFNTGIR